MIEGINAEKRGAANAAESFEDIRKSTSLIKENVESLNASVVELKDANKVIIDSIQTISAISEEVSAHAGQTSQAEEKNTEILSGIAEKMEGLMKVMKK